MPTLTRQDVALLAEIEKNGGAIFDPGTDGGCIRIGPSLYTMTSNADVIVAFEHLKERHYITSEQGIEFRVTESGRRRLLSAGW